MTHQEAIAYIENTPSTTHLSLDRDLELLHYLGDPQKRLKFIHVAGSNGKGSTCAMLEAILRCAGYRTGLFISPYIQDFCERIQVNRQNIPGEDLARITEKVRDFADVMKDHPSQFELITAIAMLYFVEQGCELVVLEVGRGGVIDATNVIDCPEAAVITNIGLEHTEYLGNTLAEIATAKGGIIKPNCAAVCYDSTAETMQTLRRICETQHASYCVSREEDLRSLSRSLDGQRFLWKGKEYELSLLGAHQLRNAAVVLETVDILRGRGWSISEEAVRRGLRDVRWPARFEVLWREPLFLLDGGHNPQCAEALARNLEDYFPGQKLTFLLGVMEDKDYRQMLTGQQVLDALEWSVSRLPNTFGGFVQVSGLSFEYDSTIDSPCVKDEKGLFDHVDETKERRVRNVLVAGKPIEADALYTLASVDYYLLGNGDGYTMFDGAKVLENGESMDIEALYYYISEVLGGHIGKGYEDMYGEGRIVSVNPEN